MARHWKPWAGGIATVAGLCLALCVARGARAQSVGDGVSTTPPGGATELAAATAEVDRLGEQARAVESEAGGIGARREALSQRARREIRLLYHLSQGAALAPAGGPEAMLEQMVRAEHVRRGAEGTLREIKSVDDRAVTLRAERARLAQLLLDAQGRRDALAARQREAEALASLQLPVTPAGVAPIPTAPSPATGPGPTGASEPAVTVYGGTVAATGGAPASFADAAGRVLFPVAGRCEVRRAQTGIDEPGAPGVEITAPLGSPVRAVFPGRVAFADRYGPYGRLVIVDHGDHYYTVSANLATLNVRVGQEVAAGAVLGTLGDDGRGPKLYFEVRRGSETVDPAPWLGI